MEIGLLWFDNRKSVGIDTKVRQAAQRYQSRFGRAANVCYVNPRQGHVRRAGGLPVRTLDNILPDHYWVGVDDGNGGQ